MDPNKTIVTFTDKAASKLCDILATDNRPGCSLRIALVRTHCMGGRGYTYRLALVECPSGDDTVFEENGVKVCVDPSSLKFLKGAELDYVEAVGEAGFKVNNPNITAKCPCGHHDIFESETN
ncbi:MAG: iron-sulfur cluster assembly accessory protein [Deltaproteobacteria bacterium]|nr:iron-sulfur cluster assembly accessory protein [Deltaproteobacteria bacterium]